MPLWSLTKERKDDLLKQVRKMLSGQRLLVLALQANIENRQVRMVLALLVSWLVVGGQSVFGVCRTRLRRICFQRDAKLAELDELQKKTPNKLWEEDLDKFVAELDVSVIALLKRCQVFGRKGCERAIWPFFKSQFEPSTDSSPQEFERSS